MGRPMSLRLRATALVLAVLYLGMPFTAAKALPSAVLEEGEVYKLGVAELATLVDTDATLGIHFAGDAIEPAVDVAGNVYVSQPLQMPEFSRLTVSLDQDAPSAERMAGVSVSVYRTQEQQWGDWIDLPDGETAGRERSREATVLLRFRITFPPADLALERTAVRSLLVTSGEPLLTRNNLVMVILMGGALFLFVARKKDARNAAAKRPAKP